MPWVDHRKKQGGGIDAGGAIGLEQRRAINPWFTGRQTTNYFGKEKKKSPRETGGAQIP